ncbi:hypothetical protein F4802DRAFT_602565 [Xylaria palmicola]|nr:hypothetical protein F4802DRAFT_602565 [Xylaria palmicola]
MSSPLFRTLRALILILAVAGYRKYSGTNPPTTLFSPGDPLDPSAYDPGIINLNTLVECFAAAHVVLLLIGPARSAITRRLSLGQFIWDSVVSGLYSMVIYTAVAVLKRETITVAGDEA